MILAVLATLFVLVIPGAVVAWLVGLSFRSLRTWAAVPALSVASVFVIGELAHVTGLPFGALTVFVVFAALAALRFVRRRAPAADSSRSAGDAHEPNDEDSEQDLTNTIALALLGLSIVAGLVTWAVGIAGHGLVPPGSDAAYHGFFVARILETNSLDVAKLAVSDPAGNHALVSYYPFGIHAVAAIAAQLTGIDIGRLLVSFTVFFAAVVLPVGMFVLARMLAPRSPLIAGFTALVVPLIALFPYAPVQFGDIPIVVGMALVPITVVLVTQAIVRDEAALSREPPRELGIMIAAGLCVLAIVAVHSSQLPITVLLVVLVVAERAVLARSARVLGDAVVRALGVAAVALVLFAPSVPSFVRGVSERSGFDNTPVQPLRDVIGPTLALDSGAFDQPTRQTLLALVAAIGVVIWLLSRRFAWVAGYAVVLAVMLLAAVSDSGLSKALSLPWYRGPARIGWNRAFFVPFFVGVVAAWTVALVARSRKNSRASIIWASIAAVAVIGLAIGYRGYDTSTDMLRYSFSNNALVTSESKAAFAWLDRHADDDDTVVNDVNGQGITTDDSVWMYAQRRLTPLFGFAQVTSGGFAPPDAAAERDLKDRIFLLTHLGGLDRDPRVQELAQRYRVRWVYFDERSITIFRHTLDLAGLLENPQLRRVFRRGPVHVFEVVPRAAL